MYSNRTNSMQSPNFTGFLQMKYLRKLNGCFNEGVLNDKYIVQVEPNKNMATKLNNILTEDHPGLRLPDDYTPTTIKMQNGDTFETLSDYSTLSDKLGEAGSLYIDRNINFPKKILERIDDLL